MADLKVMNFNGWQTIVSDEVAVRPIFQDALRYRTNRKLATNIVFTGEAGIGKSYMAIDVARYFEGCYKSEPSGEIKDRFIIDQVVFTQSDYMDLLSRLKMGKAIVFDEPSYAMGKRDWYKELNKVLAQTMESQRFLIHPMFIPVINMSLLDKTIRSYLIQYQVHVTDRGRATVYRLSPSQSTDKVYRTTMCELIYHMIDSNLCNKDSCLGCKKMDDCQIFRAQYERKKREVQFTRYEQAKDQAIRKESQAVTDKQVEDMIMQNVDNLKTNKGRLHVSKMRLYLRNEFDVYLSIWKAYNIKGLIEAAHPKMFEDS